MFNVEMREQIIPSWYSRTGGHCNDEILKIQYFLSCLTTWKSRADEARQYCLGQGCGSSQSKHMLLWRAGRCCTLACWLNEALRAASSYYFSPDSCFVSFHFQSYVSLSLSFFLTKKSKAELFLILNLRDTSYSMSKVRIRFDGPETWQQLNPKQLDRDRQPWCPQVPHWSPDVRTGADIN